MYLYPLGDYSSDLLSARKALPAITAHGIDLKKKNLTKDKRLLFFYGTYSSLKDTVISEMSKQHA